MSNYIDADGFEKYLNREEWGTPDEKWWPESEIGTIIAILPVADVVPKEEYDALKELYGRLLESACILSAAVDEYQRREENKEI